MRVVECEGKLYYREEELKMSDQAYFYGCSGRRSIIEKKSLSEGDYVFAILNKKTGLWEIKSREYRPAKVLVSKEWVEQNVPSLQTADEDDRSKHGQGIQMAPPLLDLEDHEKFREKDGKILEIEVRGEKHHKNASSLVKDISDAFMIHSLSKTLLDERATYKEGIDFINFICPKVDNSNLGPNKKLLFLTYEGLLKLCIFLVLLRLIIFENWLLKNFLQFRWANKRTKTLLLEALLEFLRKQSKKFFDGIQKRLPVFIFSRYVMP